MIVDFFQIKQKLGKIMNTILRIEVEKRTLFLNIIKKQIQHEGDKARYQTVDQETKILDYKTIESKFSFTFEESSRLSLSDITKKIQEVAEDMAKKMEGGAFKKSEKKLRNLEML